LTVCEATILDLDLVAPLFDAYRQFYRKPGDPELARRFLRDRLENGQSVIFLALLPDGAAAGFTQLYPSFSSASAARIFILNDLFVEPRFRGMGAGAALLAAARAFAEAAGAIRLTLSTEVTNESAQALYEACGWARQTDFYVYNLSLGNR
jgi:GNAT superfamily N-acetyltransferase